MANGKPPDMLILSDERRLCRLSLLAYAAHS